MSSDNPYESPVIPSFSTTNPPPRRKGWKTGAAWVIPLVWIVAGCAPSFLMGGPLLFLVGTLVVAVLGWWFTFAAFTRFVVEGHGLGELIAGICLNIVVSLYAGAGVWVIIVAINEPEPIPRAGELRPLHIDQ